MQILKIHPFFRKASHVMNVLEEHEQRSRSELKALQLERINQVWDHAIKHVPYYRTMVRERHLPRRFEDLSEYSSSVPVLSKAIVRSGALLSERAGQGRWSYTGGSTGIPLRVFWEKNAELETLCAQYRSRALWDIDIFDRSAMLWSAYDSYLPGLSGRTATLRRLFEDLLRSRLRLSALTLGKQNLRGYLRKMQDFRPAFLYGYSSATYLLALEALEAGLSIDSLKLVVLTSEVVTQEMRDTVERALRTNVVQEYGAAECPVVAYEDNQHNLRVRDDLVMVETLPTENGDYRIIISVLNNPSFPLLRYDIGDLTNKPVRQTDDGFSSLERVVGRSNDLLISKSGRRVQLPACMLALFTYVKGHQGSVRRFRAHQFSDGAVSLLLEADAPVDDIDVSRMGQTLSEILEGQIVEVRLTPAIPPTLSGKHRWIISEVVSPCV